MITTILSVSSMILIVMICAVVLWCMNLSKYYIMIQKGYQGRPCIDSLWLASILTGPIPIIGLITNAICLDVLNKNFFKETN